MQPNPRAETSSPLLPNFLFTIRVSRLSADVASAKSCDRLRRSRTARLVIVGQSYRSKQMRERKLRHLPLVVFFEIHLGHHKSIRDLVAPDYRLQINVI